jgi:UDP-N-acetylglucosamine 1-carboxyvinyltransferase
MYPQLEVVMQKLLIEGGYPLSGSIKISGAKNCAVALIPASILCDGKVTINNVPNITDRDDLNEILQYLGAEVLIKDDVMEINCTNIKNKEIPEDIAKRLRASYYFMGALLGKYKRVEIYFPGGCPIGTRPINLHLKGFKALGATIKEEENKYIIEAINLIGNHIYLDIASVGATINIMLAAVLAQGDNYNRKCC